MGCRWVCGHVVCSDAGSVGQEARERLSLPLILHPLLWGLAPSLIIAPIPLKRHQRWWHGASIRTAYTVGLVVIATGLFVVNNKYATFLPRENAGLCESGLD